MSFVEYAGDTGDLVNDDSHLVFKWNRDDCLILFSMCRKGDATSHHFTSDKSGLRLIKQAISEFFEFVRKKFKWCKMAIAQITKPSVCRIVKKLGFEYIGTTQGCDVYIKAMNHG